MGSVQLSIIYRYCNKGIEISCSVYGCISRNSSMSPGIYDNSVISRFVYPENLLFLSIYGVYSEELNIFVQVIKLVYHNDSYACE
jgi:hypothetical protein